MAETNIRTEAARVEDVRRPRGSVKGPIAEAGEAGQNHSFGA